MTDDAPTQHGHDEQTQNHEHTQQDAAAGAQVRSTGPATASIRLPFASISLSLPQVSARLAGQQGSAGAAAGSAQVERLALYGGALALGALGVLEWPVVAAAAAGTYVLSRLAGGTRSAHAFHDDHPHLHGGDCGHAAVPHGDHSDYLHDGHRHAAHGDHWDEH